MGFNSFGMEEKADHGSVQQKQPAMFLIAATREDGDMGCIRQRSSSNSDCNSSTQKNRFLSCIGPRSLSIDDFNSSKKENESLSFIQQQSLSNTCNSSTSENEDLCVIQQRSLTDSDYNSSTNENEDLIVIRHRSLSDTDHNSSANENEDLIVIRHRSLSDTDYNSSTNENEDLNVINQRSRANMDCNSSARGNADISAEGIGPLANVNYNSSIMKTGTEKNTLIMITAGPTSTERIAAKPCKIGTMNLMNPVKLRSQNVDRSISKIYPRSNTSVRPHYSFPSLITMSIESSPDRMKSSAEIYQFITYLFPYYLNNRKKWETIIQNNLCRNHCFVKVTKSSDQSGIGSLWTLSRFHAKICAT